MGGALKMNSEHPKEYKTYLYSFKPVPAKP